MVLPHFSVVRFRAASAKTNNDRKRSTANNWSIGDAGAASVPPHSHQAHLQKERLCPPPHHPNPRAVARLGGDDLTRQGTRYECASSRLRSRRSCCCFSSSHFCRSA